VLKNKSPVFNLKFAETFKRGNESREEKTQILNEDDYMDA